MKNQNIYILVFLLFINSLSVYNMYNLLVTTENQFFLIVGFGNLLASVYCIRGLYKEFKD